MCVADEPRGLASLPTQPPSRVLCRCGRACSVLNVAMPLLCNTPNLTGLAQRHGSFAIRRQVETPPWTTTPAELSRSTEREEARRNSLGRHQASL
jgi:hypothetical protein